MAWWGMVRWSMARIGAARHDRARELNEALSREGVFVYPPAKIICYNLAKTGGDALKKLILLLMAVALLFVVAGCGGVSKNNVPINDVTKTSAGNDVVLSEDTLMATSSEGMDKLIEMANANNKDAIQRMLDNKELYSLGAGTKVTVIDRGFSKANVEVATGELTGTKGILPVELLK